jgi:hypothetical protein
MQTKAMQAPDTAGNFYLPSTKRLFAHRAVAPVVERFPRPVRIEAPNHIKLVFSSNANVGKSETHISILKDAFESDNWAAGNPLSTRKSYDIYSLRQLFLRADFDELLR